MTNYCVFRFPLWAKFLNCFNLFQTACSFRHLASKKSNMVSIFLQKEFFRRMNVYFWCRALLNLIFLLILV
jgi:hypothetical protein